MSVKVSLPSSHFMILIHIAARIPLGPQKFLLERIIYWIDKGSLLP